MTRQTSLAMVWTLGGNMLNSNANMPDLGPIAVKVGIALVTRAAPKGFAIVRSWVKGREIVVVGPARAGKTTFVDYLQLGLFHPEKFTEKTPAVSPSPRFDVKIGRDKALELIVKTVVDVPGQIGAAAHADFAFEKRPHVLVIVLDSTHPIVAASDRSSVEWLREFSARLDSKWRGEARTRNRLSCVAILLNKTDKIKAAKRTSLRRAVDAITKAEFREARGRMQNEVGVFDCCLVENPQGTALIDSVVSFIAKKAS